MSYLAPSGVISSGDFLDRAVSEVMNPGVIAISDQATLGQVFRCLAVNRIHAVLVVSDADGSALGWATGAGLLGFADKDPSVHTAKSAITEAVTTIGSSASVREAIDVLDGEPSHLLITGSEGAFPSGTISELDLAAFLADH